MSLMNFQVCPLIAVIPVLIGPLQVFISFLPAILIASGGAVLAFFRPFSIRLAALLVAALIASLCYGIPKVTRAFAHSHAAAFSGGAAWPMSRGGVARRGYGGGEDPTSGGRAWSFAPRFQSFQTSPALLGNRILASSADTNAGVNRGSVVCLDAKTGAMVWEFAPPDFRATAAAPVVSGRFVICAEGQPGMHDARITCLSFETGRKLWDVRTTGSIEADPCIAGNLVFCSAGADGVYAIRLDADSSRSPVAWHLTGRDKMKINCKAAVAARDGRVYISSAALHEQDWNGILCLDATTGVEIWHADTPLPVWGAPTLDGDSLYVGLGNGTLAESAEQVWDRIQQEMSKRGAKLNAIETAAPRYNPGGELWAVEARSGKTIWTRKLRQTLASAVAAVDGRLYFAARDGLLICLTTGNEWVGQWDAHEAMEASPAVGSKYVYVVTDSGRICCLDRQTLQPVWQARLAKGDHFVSSPVVGFGHIYVGTPESGLLCVGRPSMLAPEPLFWAGARGGAGKAGCIDGSFLPAKGAFAWRWPVVDHPGDVRVVPPVATPAAALNSTVYASVCGGGRTGLAALVVGSGLSTMPPEADKWFVATTYAPGDAVAVTTSRVYLAEGKSGNAGRNLRCVDAATGRNLWQTSIDRKSSGAFLLTPGALYACCRDGELSCFAVRNADAGKLRWSVGVGDQPVGLPCVSGGLVVVAAENTLLALAGGSGRIIWRQPVAKPLRTGPVANEDVAVIATTEHLEAHSLVNGATLWARPCHPAALPLAADDERILCAQTNGELVVYGWDGRLRATVKGAATGLAPLLVGDHLLYCSQLGTLQKIDLSGKVPDGRWLATAWLGPITAPLLLSDGSVYFTTAEKGLICARLGKE